MQFGAGRSEQNFAQPNEFRPERWLVNSKTQDSPFAEDKLNASQPFSLGMRSCLGQKLAYFELRLILARMVFNFDMELPVGLTPSLIWTDQKTYATWVKEPFIIRLKPIDG